MPTRATLFLLVLPKVPATNMSDDLPEPSDEDEQGPDPTDPFSQIPMFGDLFKLFSNQSSPDWSGARQMAITIASGGESQPNVDPLERIAYEELLRIAELQIVNATGLTISSGGSALSLEVITRTEWASRTIDTYRPIFERLTESLSANQAPIDTADPSAAFLGPIMAMMGPMMLNVTAGSMVGHLAQRSLGTYDLPIPRDDGDTLVVVGENVEEFRDEWSIDVDDMRLWVCLNEVAHHAVFRIPHVRSRLLELLGDHASGFNPNPTALEDKMRNVELTGDMSGIQDLFGDPEVVLGAVQSDIQRAILPQISALVAAIEGYVDYIMDSVGSGLIGSYQMLSEAQRRRRVEADQSDRFVEQLLGLELTQEQYDMGSKFIAGLVERGGDDVLVRLWESTDTLPTPAEIAAPGLWLARVAGESSEELTMPEIEIPDDLSGLD